ncbi:MAG TPA: OsmC family protein [Saprospiraceae bacterium]|nr:OsmC family protein [Saprospiraceae bacterium]HMQ82507.1 OsmC family protein [Saprospiraceae bacterium]
MTTSTVTYSAGLRTTCTHTRSGNAIITDAPVDNHGRGEAFSPTDLVATALATCMLTVMGIAAENRGLSIDGAHAEVTKIMAADPRRISEVKVLIHMPPYDFSEAHKKLLTEIALNCPVAKSLHADLIQSVELRWGEIE